jgi:integrase
MRIKLTPAFVKDAVAQAGKDRTVYWDTTLPGFGFVALASGAKSYCVQYRANGKSRRMAIDAVLGLEQARKRARGLLGEVARDRDPLAERRAAAGVDTFRAIATEYMRMVGKSLRTAGERQQILDRLIFPALGAKQIDEIRRSDIARMLDRIELERGARMADIALSILRKIMNWHASRSDDFRSPIVPGMKRDKAGPRERILTDDELRSIWATSADGPFGALVRFLLLTAARRTEAARMARGELVEGVWTLPAERSKTGKAVERPLSGAAVAVVNGLPKIAGCDFFFTYGRVPLNSFGYQKRDLDRASGVTNWRLHDLRRTSRSLMSRAGVQSDIAERCLGHVIGGVRGIYDRHRYLEEMRHAYEALAAQIERIVNPQPNVVAVRGRRR